MSSPLDTLKKHRDQILLAEVGALLHDMGKCADEHIVHQASDKQKNHHYQYKSAYSHLLPLRYLKLLSEQVSLRDLVEKSKPRVINKVKEQWLIRTLGRCHAAAHIEKEEADKSGKQPRDSTRPSTAFGYELHPVRNLTARLKALPFDSIENRDVIQKRMGHTFSEALGETRRPENEVTLWDWSSMVAAMYKAAIAAALLNDKVEPAELRWKLLSVRVDGLGFFGGVTDTSDLLARKELLEEAFEKVRLLLEETFPLGTRVYEDINTGMYVVPDLPDLLTLTTSESNKTLLQLIQEAFANGTVQGDSRFRLSGELVPLVKVHQRSWWGQSPSRERSKDEVPPVVEALISSSKSAPDVEVVRDWWQDTSQGEVCPVCRLRPVKEGGETCEHCWKRRRSRIGAWKQDPSSTIWMDEVADGNGRVALIVGKFGLDDWLSGDLVQTLLVKAAKGDPSGCEPKNSSPARLRRVWETTQRFWEETVVDGLLEHLPERSRWELFPDSMPDVPEETVCDGTLGGWPISVVRVGDRFLTVFYLSEKPSPGYLNISWEKGRNKEHVSCTVNEVRKANGELAAFRCYRPYLPLVSSPDQFLALVPADNALDVANGIRKEYEKQFGKVQNRLPIFLGLIFFQRKTPLAAVIDTGRRMLDQVDMDEEIWEISDKEVSAERVSLTLKKDGLETTLGIPMKMGDNTTDDVWYPYFFFEGEPGERERCFKHGDRWLVHAGDLREGDRVCITPSRSSYIYLEHTAQRFRFNPEKDVMLLDDLQRLSEMWDVLIKTRGMTDTKLRNIQALFEAKWQLWQLDATGAPDYQERLGIFKHLIETTFKHAGITGVPVHEVLNGNFRHCLELYLHILRRRVKEEQSG